MQSIESKSDNLYEIKKSKFYSYAYPVFSEQDIKECLDAIREEHRFPTHICYAYVVTNPNLEKAVEDGEPSGTAGKPILELIKKRNLNNILIVVVRYFGGIKLGAGGLIRAYTTASSEVLDKTNVIEYGEYTDMVIRVAHGEYRDIKNFVDKDTSIYLLDTIFANDVELYISVRVDMVDLVKAKVMAMLKKDSITICDNTMRVLR